MSPTKIRSEVLKLSKLSVKQPDYDFIQGYFLRLGLLPDIITPTKCSLFWLRKSKWKKWKVEMKGYEQRASSDE